MITYETLKTYKDKCKGALQEVVDAIAEAEKSLEMLGRQGIAITAQIETLETLMDREGSPPIVELPFVGPEDIEEMFDKRLDTHDGSSKEEAYQERQDVYRIEAMESVEALDELNNRGED